MWCLARLLPLMIGDTVPEGDPNWNNFLLLLSIADYISSPIASRGIATLLTTLAEESFRELYPECPIIPKQHYLVHVPQWRLKYVKCTLCRVSMYHWLYCVFVVVFHRCGPPCRYWCIRFEANNGLVSFPDLNQSIYAIIHPGCAAKEKWAWMNLHGVSSSTQFYL